MSSPAHPDPAALAALHRAFSAKSEALEARHGLSAAPGASTQPAQPGSGLARVVQRLARGQQVVLHVVGGSAAAGAGGVGVNHTFDARLVAAFNSVLEQAEEGGTRLGRLKRSNVAQGGTSSFWAGLVGEALHGRRRGSRHPHHAHLPGVVDDQAASAARGADLPGRQGQRAARQRDLLVAFGAGC